MPTNKKYKDSVFTLLFNDKEKLIKLYNGIKGTDYSPDTPIEINTLEDALMNDRINDISFILDGKMVVLLEHQSTINPNMPLRMLLYMGRIYEKIIDNKAIYTTLQMKIPTPEFYVMYNGIEEYPQENILKLSDAYIVEDGGKVDLELIVKVLNINYNKNNKVLKKVEELKEYSQFIEKVREFLRAKDTLEEAIKRQ